ncbi:PRC and DUF2382 domain-containing protein [Cellulomonas aerilata]|uniref:Photosystem reaction center subunit H n=1 Tax=Cellulomonas aerilata TaxID=515326 RepID=A0A512D9W4_9CELL|nr:PRC and DUF2382 domain-containing protein [Cellulomonas aerilata]GEO33259.1 hypothetical protein CAE01nite_09840 [Cellulomonas aerilata]
MITVHDMEGLMFAGGDVVGDDGSKIGRLGQLFLDARTGHPAWVTVTTGLFGKAESFVPMNGAELHGDVLQVPYSKDLVKHAPRIASAEGHLSPDEERDLYRHYGLIHDEPEPVEDTGSHGRHAATGAPTVDEAGGTGLGAQTPAVGLPTGATPLGATSPGPPPLHSYDDVAREARDADPHVVGADDVEAAGVAWGGASAVTPAVPATEAPATAGAAGPAAEGVVLSAERARVVGTERVPTERVRMRRYTVTEHKQITVPVQREEVRVEYEPVDEGVLPDAQDPAGAPGTGEPDDQDRDRRL